MQFLYKLPPAAVEFVKPSEIAGGKGICKHEKKEEQQQVNPAEKQHRSKSPRTDPGEEPNRYHGNNGEQGGFEGKRDGDRITSDENQPSEAEIEVDEMGNREAEKEAGDAVAGQKEKRRSTSRRDVNVL